VTLEVGQLLTSMERIASDTGLSVQNVRTALKNLEKTKEILKKSTSKNTVITVCNYSEYQNTESEANNQPTNNQQAANKQLTNNQQTTNNIQEGKKDKKDKKDNTLFALSAADAALRAGCNEAIFDALKECYSEKLSYVSEKQVVLLLKALSSSIYCGVDVTTEIKKAANWESVNPSKAKTPRGTPKFLLGWVDRAQDRAGHQTALPAPVIGQKQPVSEKPAIDMSRPIFALEQKLIDAGDEKALADYRMHVLGEK
jgi:DNA-binding transcriptional regulator YhcF (GntR family)